MSSIFTMIIYFVILMVLPLWAQHKVKSNYEKYSQVRSTSGKTGREVALEILHANGIYDVEVVKGEGFLTDDYDPKKKVVSLSPANYDRPLLELQLQPTKLVMPFKITKDLVLKIQSSISTCCKPREFIKLYDHHVRYYLNSDR